MAQNNGNDNYSTYTLTNLTCLVVKCTENAIEKLFNKYIFKVSTFTLKSSTSKTIYSCGKTLTQCTNVYNVVSIYGYKAIFTITFQINSSKTLLTVKSATLYSSTIGIVSDVDQLQEDISDENIKFIAIVDDLTINDEIEFNNDNNVIIDGNNHLLIFATDNVTADDLFGDTVTVTNLIIAS